MPSKITVRPSFGSTTFLLDTAEVTTTSDGVSEITSNEIIHSPVVTSTIKDSMGVSKTSTTESPISDGASKAAASGATDLSSTVTAFTGPETFSTENNARTTVSPLVFSSETKTGSFFTTDGSGLSKSTGTDSVHSERPVVSTVPYTRQNYVSSTAGDSTAIEFSSPVRMTRDNQENNTGSTTTHVTPDYWTPDYKTTSGVPISSDETRTVSTVFGDMTFTKTTSGWVPLMTSKTSDGKITSDSTTLVTPFTRNKTVTVSTVFGDVNVTITDSPFKEHSSVTAQPNGTEQSIVKEQLSTMELPSVTVGTEQMTFTVQSTVTDHSRVTDETRISQQPQVTVNITETSIVTYSVEHNATDFSSGPSTSDSSESVLTTQPSSITEQSNSHASIAETNMEVSTTAVPGMADFVSSSLKDTTYQTEPSSGLSVITTTPAFIINETLAYPGASSFTDRTSSVETPSQSLFVTETKPSVMTGEASVTRIYFRSTQSTSVTTEAPTTTTGYLPCPEGIVFGRAVDPDDCHKFYECRSGIETIRSCGELYFNVLLANCGTLENISRFFQPYCFN
ncbi:uncharacterized protein LOC135477231 isoform X3 [Liolophura sinensis]|uniref:uncharacterized protein LOC135477231 isoform X3 n=1 Tax=Liolophura sinensis TaxID=3198878 RepID=UPI003158D40A